MKNFQRNFDGPQYRHVNVGKYTHTHAHTRMHKHKFFHISMYALEKYRTIKCTKVVTEVLWPVNTRAQPGGLFSFKKTYPPTHLQ